MNFDVQHLLLVLNTINFIFIMYNFYLYRKVSGEVKNTSNGNAVNLNKESGDDIQSNLGRRLLELQRGRYARPYGRFTKENEDK